MAPTDSPPRVRVLVVDDDLEIVAMLQALAAHHPSIELTGVTSPEAAMALSRTEPPDAILLDHNFPTAEPSESALPASRLGRGLTGLEAVEFLRAAAPRAVIAMYTATIGLGDSAEHAGADLYRVKGPDPGSVLDELAEQARRRQEA